MTIASDEPSHATSEGLYSDKASAHPTHVRRSRALSISSTNLLPQQDSRNGSNPGIETSVKLLRCHVLKQHQFTVSTLHGGFSFNT